MRTIYLPDSIYEHLPKVYLLLAVVLLLTPMSFIKWPVIATLLVGSMWIKEHRQKYRREQQIRELEATQRKYRKGARCSLGSQSPMMVL